MPATIASVEQKVLPTESGDSPELKRRMAEGIATGVIATAAYEAAKALAALL